MELMARLRTHAVKMHNIGLGQFRFTPPTHSLLAFNQALAELEEEGGVAARGRRYRENQTIVTEGLKSLGFKTYVEWAHLPSFSGFSRIPFLAEVLHTTAQKELFWEVLSRACRTGC